MSLFKRNDDLYDDVQKTYVIRLKGRFAVDLDLESKKTGLTKAAIIKIALNQYFGKIPKDQERQRN